MRQVGGRLFQTAWNGLPLVIILAAYVGVVWFRLWAYPYTSDSVAYCNNGVTPTKATYLFERYFTFYLIKWLTWPFADRLAACGAASLLQHGIAVWLAYSITVKLAGPARAALAASLTALTPMFVFTPFEFSTDNSALIWGLAGVRVSLSTWADRSRAFAAGFCIVAAILSKVFGIVFAPAILLVLWPFRHGSAFPAFGAGGLAVVAIVALGDWIHLQDVTYHLNPANYLGYAALIQSKLAALGSPAPGAEALLSLPRLLRSDLFFLYFLLVAATSVWLAGRLVNHGVKDIRARAAAALILSGIGIILLFAQSYVHYPGHTIQWNYVYCLVVPWAVAFCCAEPGAQPAHAAGRREQWPAFAVAVGFVVILFLAYLTVPAVRLSPVGERVVDLLPPWMLLAGLALGAVGTASTVRSGATARWSAVPIVVSSLVIMTTMAVEGAALKPVLITGAQQETIGFVRRYRNLSARGPVIPVACNSERRTPVFMSLMLAGLATDEDLMYLGEIPGHDAQIEGFFEKTGAAREFVRHSRNGFYIWTGWSFDELRSRARRGEFDVLRIADGAWFGCSFYWVGRDTGDLDGLRQWLRESGKAASWIAVDPLLRGPLSADLETVSMRPLDPVLSFVPVEIPDGPVRAVDDRLAYLWTARVPAGNHEELRLFAIARLGIERALNDARSGYAIVSRASVYLRHCLARVSWARLEYENDTASLFAIQPRLLEKIDEAENATLRVRSGDGTTGEFVVTPQYQTFTLPGSGASAEDNIHFYLDRPGRFYLDDVVFGVVKGDRVMNALSAADSTFESLGNWHASGHYSAARRIDTTSRSGQYVLDVIGAAAGGGNNVVSLTTPFFEYWGGPTHMTFRARVPASPPCVGRATANDLEWLRRQQPQAFSSLAKWLSGTGTDISDLRFACVVD